jgi:hypothetical protein
MFHLPRVLQHISPSKLRHLQALPVLEELTLGCHHRLIASTVTDSCLVELVALTNLKHLNLSQCVHVRDAGAASAGQVGDTLALSLAQSFCRSDANPTWRASDLSFVSSLHYLFTNLHCLASSHQWIRACIQSLLMTSPCHQPALRLEADFGVCGSLPCCTFRHDVTDEPAFAGITKHQRLCRHY